MRTQIATLATVMLITTAAAQDCEAATRSLKVDKVDCEQRYVLIRAMEEQRDTDAVAAYTMLRLALARAYDSQQISADTYLRLDTVALEMFLNTMNVRHGHLVVKGAPP